MKQINKFKIAGMMVSVLLVGYTDISRAEEITQPKAYSYWAGWSNTDIPNFSFDGLFLASAF